jgi:hypothetical protein
MPVSGLRLARPGRLRRAIAIEQARPWTRFAEAYNLAGCEDDRGVCGGGVTALTPVRRPTALSRSSGWWCSVSSRMLAPPWFGSSRPMLSAVVCSGTGRGQGTALEDFGEELGGGGEMFLVPGPYAPPQVGKADLQLVAVVAYGCVDEGALVGS